VRRIVAATDGCRLLVQGGFRFPWPEELLVAASPAFFCREIPQGASVRAGRSGPWLCLDVGPWRLYLVIRNGCEFPKVDDYLPDAAAALASIELASEDAQCATEALTRLGDNVGWHVPVTLETDGRVLLRTKTDRQVRATELVFSRSTPSGMPMSVRTQGKFLARAIRLGFRRLYLYGPDRPILAEAETRKLVWAPIDPAGLLEGDGEAIRITSSSVPTRPARVPAAIGPRAARNAGRATPRGKRARRQPRPPSPQTVAFRQTLCAIGTLLRETASQIEDLAATAVPSPAVLQRERRTTRVSR
jgi:hypothetical protein